MNVQNHYRSMLAAIALCAVSLLPATAQTDNVRINGAFTSFTGVVVGDNQTFMAYCGVDSCGVLGGAPPPVICPDSGCSTSVGVATKLLGSPRFDVNSSVTFWVSGNLTNNLTFTTNGEGGLLPIDPAGEFKLGTITYTNG